MRPFSAWSPPSKGLLSNQTKNAELFALTYGALVVQLIQDYEDYPEVNKQLEKMGYNIGTRLIEEFLAKTSLGRCADFKDVGEVITKVIRGVWFCYCGLNSPP